MWVNNLSWILYVVTVIDIEPIRERFSAVAPFVDERGRRLVAAAEAFAAGYGGITAVAMATGVAPSTIGRGLKELAQASSSRSRVANLAAVKGVCATACERRPDGDGRGEIRARAADDARRRRCG